MPSQMAFINGGSYQHKDIDYQIHIVHPASTGLTWHVTTFKSINYKTGRKHEAVRNWQGKIIGDVTKQQETEGAETWLKNEWNEFYDWVLGQGIADELSGKPIGVGDLLYLHVLTYGNTRTNLQTDKVLAKFEEDAKKSQDDQAVLVQEIPLFVRSVNDPNRVDFNVYR